MMRRWDCREVPTLLFEFGRFREKFGGKGLLEVMIGLEKDPGTMRLPKVSSVSTGYRTRRDGSWVDCARVGAAFPRRHTPHPPDPGASYSYQAWNEAEGYFKR